jgi:diacylglycerol kinase family enzyme
VADPQSTVPADADRVLILVNPKAGRESPSDKVGQLAALLDRRGLRVESSSDLDHVCRTANEAFQHGTLRALVGVGGDGTAAELVNRTEPGLPICLYPLGTANLLAGYLRLPESPAAVCRAIEQGSLLKMDAGVAAGRIFLLMASCGFDADVVYEVHRRRHLVSGGHLTRWSYVKPILDAVRSYQYPEIRVYWDRATGVQGEQDSGTVRARWVFVSNIPPYGWGMQLAPWADGTDGALDLCTFDGGSLWNGLRYLAAAQLGWHRHLRDCRVVRVTRLRITSDRPVMYQLDGDPGGWLPLEIEVLPGRLTLVVPRGHRFRA